MMMINSQQQQQQPQQQPQQPRQLVIVVEGTAALGPGWPLLLVEYVEKIVRNFSGFNATNQKLAGPTGEMALIVYNTHGSQNGCIVQQSGWTANVDVFLHWLSSIDFMGGGFGDAAVAEALAEALLMCCSGAATTQVAQGRDFQKHCVLIAASNPRRIPTPVPSPPVLNSMQSEGNEDMQSEQWWLADADTVAQAFRHLSVSLSVVSPRQLPLLKNIFSQATRSGRASESSAEPPKQYPQHLVLLSEGFLEARMALHRGAIGPSTMPQNGVAAKTEQHQPSTVPSSTLAGQMPAPAGRLPQPGVSTGIGPMSGRSGPNMPIQQPVTVKTEAVTTGSLLHNNANNTLPTSGAVPSQDALGQQPPFNSSMSAPDSTQDFKNLGMPVSQPLRSVGATALPNNNMLVHSPSSSRHTINSPSLPPSSPLGSLQQAPGASGVPGPTIMPPAATGPLSGTQQGTSSAGVSGQPSGVAGVIPSTVGLGGVGQGVGAGAGGSAGVGAGAGAVHSSYKPATAILGGTTMMPTQQTSSGVATGQVPGSALGGQGGGGAAGAPGGAGAGAGGGSSGLSSSTQLGPNVLSHPGQNMMPVGGTSIGNSGTGPLIPPSGLPQGPGQLHKLGVMGNTGVQAPVHPASTTGTPPQPQQQTQQTNNSLKYTKLWEGILAGQRKGNVPIPICKLEGYRRTSSPDTLAADWPTTMQIIRLIPQDFMNQKDYQNRAELLVFRPLLQHDFLVQLAEKKLCAVIQLPSQTLLLASTEKPGRMIGMLFPGDMVNIKPQVSSQQQQQQQPAAATGSAPQSGAAASFSQNQLQGQLQNQLQSNQLPNQMPNQQSRSQLLPGGTGLHGGSFLQ